MSANEMLSDIAARAETIYIPKSGREQPDFMYWLSEVARFDVPTFDDRQYVKESGGKKYVIARSTDIPGLVSAEIGSVSCVGTDKEKEWQYSQSEWASNLRSWKLGKSSCKMSIIGPRDKREEFRDRLKTGDEIVLATSYPGIAEAESVQRDYNFRIVYLSGCVEGAIENGLAEAALEIVQTGETMQANRLDTVEDLWQIYPTFIWSSELYTVPMGMQAPAKINDIGIENAVKTIKNKARLVLDLDELPQTYTETLLSNVNEIVKKYGSESAELLQAFLKEGDKALVNEAADVVYSIFVMLCQRKVDPKLIFTVLQQRNQKQLKV